MNVLVPGALGLAALAVPLIVLYMLRSKRRRVEVPSTLLWQDLEEAVSSAVPWRPLKWTMLLVLQLLVLALFVFSLARPFSTERALLGPHTVFVIDTSGSMATAGRLDAAIDRARSLARDVSDANQVSIVAAGPRPEVMAAFARTETSVGDALDRIEVTGGAGRLDDAVALARGLATPDRATSLLILSDGGTGPLQSEPVLGASHLLFDATDANVSLDALTPEPSQGVLRAFLSVSNHGNRAVTASVTLSVDDLPVGSVPLTVEPGTSASTLVPLDASPGAVVSAWISEIDGRVRPDGVPPDAARLEDGALDANPYDDRSWFVLGGGQERTVSILGNGSPFLDALVTATPGFASAGGAADVVVVDGGPLPELDRPAWIIRPERPPEGIRVVEVARNLAVTSQRPGEPILDGVDLSSLAVAEAQVVETTTWTPIVAAGDVPLVLLGEVNGRPAVYTTFDLTHSNLPVDVAFPVMGSRILQWLVGGTAGAVSGGLAGEPITINPPPGTEVVVTGPDGRAVPIAGRFGDFADTGLPGIYRVDFVGEDGEIEPGPVAIRTFDPRESVAVAREIAVAAASTGDQDDTALIRELAPWIIGTVLALMAVEWWVGHQRPRLRARQAVMSG